MTADIQFDITKLPRKVQAHIARLEQTIHEKQNRINNLTESSLNPQDCTTVIYPFYDIEIGMPEDTKIRLKLPDPDFPERTRDLHIQVYQGKARIHGDETLVIIPSASNSVHIEFASRRA